MRTASRSLAAAALIALAGLLPRAQATSLTVISNVLTFAGTVTTPFLAGENLSLDTDVTVDTGALTQAVTFNVGVGVTSITGGATWISGMAAGTGPRLVGFNFDLLDSTDTVVASDSFTSVTAGTATSSFFYVPTPGTYTLLATGTAQRASVLDISLDFGPASPAPEPGTYALLLAGLGVIAAVRLRRQRA